MVIAKFAPNVSIEKKKKGTVSEFIVIKTFGFLKKPFVKFIPFTKYDVVLVLNLRFNLEKLSTVVSLIKTNNKKSVM